MFAAERSQRLQRPHVAASGPADAQAAFALLQTRHCRSLLDPQFVDIGVSQAGNSWRIVLARPLLDGDLGEWQEEGQLLLVLVNALRTRSRNCGDATFTPAPPVAWNAALGTAAERYSRAMANGNFFARTPATGPHPADLARALHDDAHTALSSLDKLKPGGHYKAQHFRH